jgi:DNA-binding XRE family transcriptional regulator
MKTRDEQADAPQVRARPALVSPARSMSGSPSIAVMQRELGRQLAALRRQARLTQQQLAARAGFSRSTVSVAEIGRQAHAREFWAACDKAGPGHEQGAHGRLHSDRGSPQHAAARRRPGRTGGPGSTGAGSVSGSLAARSHRDHGHRSPGLPPLRPGRHRPYHSYSLTCRTGSTTSRSLSVFGFLTAARWLITLVTVRGPWAPGMSHA